MNCYFYTFGCKVNTCETAGMQSLLQNAGYTVVSQPEQADIFLFNSCTVTASGAMDSYMTYLTGSGVALNVYGSDMEQMQSAAKTLAAKLATVPGTENVSDGLEHR